MISPLVFPTFPFLRQLPQALYRYLLFCLYQLLLRFRNLVFLQSFFFYLVYLSLFLFWFLQLPVDFVAWKPLWYWTANENGFPSQKYIGRYLLLYMHQIFSVIFHPEKTTNLVLILYTKWNLFHWLYRNTVPHLSVQFLKKIEHIDELVINTTCHLNKKIATFFIISTLALPHGPILN